MKKFVMCFVLFCCPICFAGFQFPIVTLSFNQGVPSTVFYGETLHIPLDMVYYQLRGEKIWIMPNNVSLKKTGGICPSIPYDSDNFYYPGRYCYMELVIPGTTLGAVISGALSYHVWGDKKSHTWNEYHPSPSFYITVIPHPLSMLAIPEQKATANLSFAYSLQSSVKYYTENQNAGQYVQGVVIPAEQDGLYFDQTRFSIVGTPTRTGDYIFQVGAKNSKGNTNFVPFKIEVKENTRDKPVFKKSYSMISAMPAQHYFMNLMDLLVPKTGYLQTNQVFFRIEPNIANPEWLRIAEDGVHLVGRPPKNMAGAIAVLTLIAKSNTGGDSAPLHVKIPVVYDSTKKPSFREFNLEKQINSALHVNLSGYIDDPAKDPSLKVTLDKVEPQAPWLTISNIDPLLLEGTVPANVTGQKYMLTLRAHTEIGGSSSPIVVPLQIKTNPEFTPVFKEDIALPTKM